MLQVLWDARLLDAKEVTADQIKTKYGDQLRAARCEKVLAPIYGFRVHYSWKKWRTLKTNDARIGAYLDVIKKLNIDGCIKHLKDRVSMHATQAEFLRLLEDAETVPVPSALTEPDYWPKFTFQGPYLKCLSTGEGDSYEEHHDDFINKAPALKKSLKAAGDDAGTQLRQRYGSRLLRVFLQAMMSPAAQTARGTSLRFRNCIIIPQQSVYELLADKFATSEKEAGTFEADDLLDATQQRRIDEYYRRRFFKKNKASRGSPTLATSSIPRPSARSASSAA